MKFVNYLLLITLVMFGSQPSYAQFGAIFNKVNEALGNKNNNGDLNDDPNEEPELNETAEVVGDAAIGAGVCGGIAMLLGKSSVATRNAALLCGAANATVTILAQQGKKEYAEKYEQITEDMEASEAEIIELELQRLSTQDQITQTNTQIEDLMNQSLEDEQFIEQAYEVRQNLNNELSQVRQSRSEAEAKLVVIEQQIADMQVIIDDSPDIEELNTTLSLLVAQRDRLVDSVNASNNANEELVAQMDRLDTEIIERS